MPEHQSKCGINSKELMKTVNPEQCSQWRKKERWLPEKRDCGKFFKPLGKNIKRHPHEKWHKENI